MQQQNLAFYEPVFASRPLSLGLRGLLLLCLSLGANIAAAAGEPAATSAPKLRFEPATLDFGTVDTGVSGPFRETTLFNDSGSEAATGLHFESDVEFPKVDTFGIDFFGRCDRLCCEGRTLQPGMSCVVSPKFNPNSPGQKSATLTVTSAEADTAVLGLSGVGGHDYVLYSQPHHKDYPTVFAGMWITEFTNTPGYSAEMADDFLIEDPAGWVIRKVGFEQLTFGRGAKTTSVSFRKDVGGLPGTEVLCPQSVPTQVRFDAIYEQLVEVELNPPCKLSPGHYWVIPKFTAESYPQTAIAWGMQFVKRSRSEVPPLRYNSPIWRHSGGFTLRKCRDWTAIAPADCGLDEDTDFAAYGTVFWLAGQRPVFVDGFEPSSAE
jgi:hypothetical protein